MKKSYLKSKSKSRTKSKSAVKPLSHQELITKFITNPKNRGLVVFHSVGSGKTLTSLFAAKKLLKQYPDKNVIIATGTSLIQVFDKELKKMKMQDNPRIVVTSYGVLINRIKKSSGLCKNNILIIDEAHNFGRDGVRSKELIKCSKKAFKVLLLTATPVRNTPLEMANLMAMLTDEKASEIEKQLEYIIYGSKYSGTTFKNLFKCNVSFYQNVKKANADFPDSTEHEVKLRMSRSYYAEYYKIQENVRQGLPDIFANSKDLLYFLNGARRAVNKTNIISPKINWIMEKIHEDLKNNKKLLIYSSWKDSGINIIKELLDTFNIKYSEITGEVSKKARKTMVDDYNSNKTKVMFVTSAGSEGLDLKGTRSIIIMEPHWNSAKIDQIIGRGIRYGSHTHLPKEQRHVDVYRLILEKPYIRYLSDLKIPSADEILTAMSLRKAKTIDLFYKNLEMISIENNPRCTK